MIGAVWFNPTGCTQTMLVSGRPTCLTYLTRLTCPTHLTYVTHLTSLTYPAPTLLP